MTEPLNKFSSRITQPRSQGASQAMLYATGMSEEDMNKAQVGIASVWYEGNPCNMHLLDLSEEVKHGVTEAGLYGMRFNTVGVSDGISMGTDGMSFSLQSRDLIADSIETIMGAQWYDALVTIPGCDKNMPGCVMAMGRLNRPALMVYGGTIKPGCYNDQKLDIVSAFQSYGEYIADKIDDETRQAIVRNSCPGAGACGGMYTANTMATAIEAMGMSLPYSASIPAVDPDNVAECHEAGAAIRKLMEMDLKTRDIMTREAFENSILCSNRLNVLTQFWIDGMTGWPRQCLRAAAAILDNARWLAARGRLRQLWWPGAFEDVLKFLGELRDDAIFAGARQAVVQADPFGRIRHEIVRDDGRAAGFDLYIR